MTALIEGQRLPVDLIYSEGWIDAADGTHTALNLGPLSDGIDWQVNCPKLESLLLEGAEKISSTCYQTSPFRFAVAADYIEEYPTSVWLQYHWGNKTLPPTTEFLALVLRSVVE